MDIYLAVGVDATRQPVIMTIVDGKVFSGPITKNMQIAGVDPMGNATPIVLSPSGELLS